MSKLQLSWFPSQHSLRKWNPRGGRWSSVEESTSKIPLKKKYFGCLLSIFQTKHSPVPKSSFSSIPITKHSPMKSFPIEKYTLRVHKVTKYDTILWGTQLFGLKNRRKISQINNGDNIKETNHVTRISTSLQFRSQVPNYFFTLNASLADWHILFIPPPHFVCVCVCF